MSDPPESDVRPWAQALSRLYADEVVAGVADRIDTLLSKYRKVVDQSNQKPLSEGDVLLITYGDTLVDGETPPLQVLHRFHRDYLNGIFDLVHILPFHPHSSDEGFSIIDYYAVRQDIGTWSDIEHLSQDCRVMADAVINHTSSQSDWFQGFLAGRPEYAEFFVESDPTVDLSDVVRPRTSPLLTRYEDADGRNRNIWTTFSADQVDLNYRNPEVLLAILDVLFFLIQQGARLLRLDAVTYLWKQPGTPSANLPETHAIIKVIRGAVDDLRADVVVVTETNVPHHENVAYFGNGHDEAHMVYNFALPPLIAHSLINGDSRRISDWARQLSLPSGEVCFLNFSASHDGVGVRPVEEILDSGEVQRLVDAAQSAQGMVSFRTLSDGEKKPYELNCSFLDLISRPEDSQATMVQRFIASQAIVLSMPGVPAIYIQSLLGTRNDLARVKKTGHARSVNRSRHKYTNVQRSLEDGDSLSAMIFNELTRLIAARRRENAFNPYGDFRILDLGHDVFAIRRQSPQTSECVDCIVNLTGRNVDVTTEMSGFDVLAGEEVDACGTVLAPYAVRWIRCMSKT